MKKKLFFTGMLVCVLAFGMAVVGCGDKEEENADPKTIRITGLEGKSGYANIMGVSSPDSESGIMGEGDISGDSAELRLYFYTGEAEAPTRWTGTGAYYLMLFIGDGYGGSEYIYTDGKTLEQLGVYGEVSGEQDIAKLPKYSIKDATSIIAFSKFVAMPTGEE